MIMYRLKGLKQEELRQKWNYHVEKEEWFEGEWNDEERIIELFGNPPYEFLEVGDKAPSKLYTRKRKLIKTDQDKSENPAPNYQSLGPVEFIDYPNGLEYWPASGNYRERLKEMGIINRDYVDPLDVLSEKELPFNMGTQVFWIRVPIKKKKDGIIKLPELGDKLLFFHVNSNTLSMGIISQVSFDVKHGRSTGSIVLEEFVIVKQTNQASKYKKVMAKH